MEINQLMQLNRSTLLFLDSEINKVLTTEGLLLSNNVLQLSICINRAFSGTFETDKFTLSVFHKYANMFNETLKAVRHIYRVAWEDWRNSITSMGKEIENYLFEILNILDRLIGIK